MVGLSASVGTFGRNRQHDVTLVQTVLTRKGYTCGPIDGRCGRHTVAAIFAVQKGVIAEPDGRVDVGGPTWRNLAGQAAASPRTTQAPGSARVAGLTQPYPAGAASPPVSGRPKPASPAAVSAADASYRRAVPMPPADTINVGLTCPGSAWMEGRLGRPRSDFSDQCQDMTNPRLLPLVEMRRIGAHNYLGLRPALDSLQDVMAEIAQRLPDLYPHLGSAGMLCCRNIRGSVTAISNHSWGTAVDIAIDGQVEPMGPGTPYLGLSLIAPIFNEHGWFWGGGYTHRKDCMHFECSQTLVNSFAVTA